MLEWRTQAFIGTETVGAGWPGWAGSIERPPQRVVAAEEVPIAVLAIRVDQRVGQVRQTLFLALVHVIAKAGLDGDLRSDRDHQRNRDVGDKEYEEQLRGDAESHRDALCGPLCAVSKRVESVSWRNSRTLHIRCCRRNRRGLSAGADANDAGEIARRFEIGEARRLEQRAHGVLLIVTMLHQQPTIVGEPRRRTRNDRHQCSEPVAPGR